MNVDSIKIELIEWVTKLSDQNSLKKILRLKKELSIKNKTQTKIFGSGKHLVSYISDDFNAPLDAFNDYQK